MQIVSSGDNLHETPKPIFWKNKKNVNLSSDELAQRVLKVKFASTKNGKFRLDKQIWRNISELILTFTESAVRPCAYEL